MRDPKRIRPILERLAAVWEANPDLRLGQIVCNAGQYGLTLPHYHVEDDELARAIESVHTHGRQPPPRAEDDIKPDNSITATARNGDVHLRFPGRIYVMSPGEARRLAFALSVAAGTALGQAALGMVEQDDSGTVPEQNHGDACGEGRKHK